MPHSTFKKLKRIHCLSKHLLYWGEKIKLSIIFFQLKLLKVILTIVFNWLSISEKLEGWVASDFVFLSERGLHGGIYLSQLDFGFLLFQSCGSLGIFRGQTFAVTAPWCIWWKDR